MNKILMGIAIGLVIGVFGFWIVSSMVLPTGETENQEIISGTESGDEEDMTICAQVITPARDPETGDIREFPTPCDVLEGWEVIQNDIPGLELDVQ